MQFGPFNRGPFNRMRMPHDRFLPPGAFRPHFRNRWPDVGLDRPRWKPHDGWERDRRGSDRLWLRENDVYDRQGFRGGRSWGREGHRSDTGRIVSGVNDLSRMNRSQDGSELKTGDDVQHKRANDSGSCYNDSMSSNRDDTQKLQRDTTSQEAI
jgi:hypothetical protein